MIMRAITPRGKLHSATPQSLLTSKTLIPFLFGIWCLFFVLQGRSSSLRGQDMHKFTPALFGQKTEASNVVPVQSDHLVIVPGHAAMRISELATAATTDSAWYLLPYQLNQGFPEIITAHIRKAVSIATEDAKSALLFSGGQTRLDVGPFSEAASYYYLASSLHWLDHIQSRVYLEEFARDSFENLLFSICRFREAVGSYPSRITVVGFDFKAKRYADLHRRALGFPEQNFTYVSVHSPGKFNQEHAVQGEAAVYTEFERDMYGCRDRILTEKKHQRDPFHRTVPYKQACPELAELFDWCGPGLYDPRSLPWVAPQ